MQRDELRLGSFPSCGRLSAREDSRQRRAIARCAVWLVLCVAGLWIGCFCFPTIWNLTGIGEPGRPFLDLYGILSASDAVAAGIDPFTKNPLDPYHRPFLYSEWWLWIGKFGLGRDDVLWLGASTLLVVLITAVVVSAPRRLKEAGGLFLVLVSPAMLFAVNRGNNDLAIFVLGSLALLAFRSDGSAFRFFGLVAVGLAAGLKYYPLAAAVMLFDAKSRRGFLVGLAVIAGVLLLAWPAMEKGFRTASQFVPRPDGLYAFGAPVLLRNLRLESTVGWVVPGLVAVGWAAIIVWRQRDALRSLPVDRNQERDFVVGAAMLVGLFFLGATYTYKFVFALWLVPWLCARDDQRVLWPGRTAIASLLFGTLWLEGTVATTINCLGLTGTPRVRGVMNVTLFTTQVMTWALMACLLQRVFAYVYGRGLALVRSPG